MCKYCNVEAGQEGIRFDEDKNSGKGFYLDWTGEEDNKEWDINYEDWEGYTYYSIVESCPKCGRVFSKEEVKEESKL